MDNNPNGKQWQEKRCSSCDILLDEKNTCTNMSCENCPDYSKFSIIDENGSFWMIDESLETGKIQMEHLVKNFTNHYFFLCDVNDNVIDEGGNEDKL